MSKVIRFADTQSQCWSRVDLDNGEPICISIARTGISVKKSQLGILGVKLYAEGDISKITRTVEALRAQITSYDVPDGMKNPILRAFTQAALEARSAEELSARLNQAMATQRTEGPQTTNVVKKLQVDHIYSLARPEWEIFAKRMTHATMKVQLSTVETGIGVMMYDPSTGAGVSFQPLYRDNVSPPDLLIVGQYLPSGIVGGLTDELKRAVEAAAQDELGPAYSVSATYFTKPPLDGIELMITRRGQ